MRVYNVAVPPPVTDIVPDKSTVTAPVSGGRVIAYGVGNVLPQVALEAALNSGTCARAVEKLGAFIEGTGFPESIADLEVPGRPGYTIGEAWTETCSYGAHNKGAAFLIKYNNAGEIGEVHILPFGSVRKTDRGTFMLSHKFGRKGFKVKDATEHMPFNDDPDVVRAILERAELPVNPNQPDGPKIGQSGQILYAYARKAGEEDYPLPPYWPGVEDVLADSEYARFDLDEVRGGFNAKGLLALIGKQDDQTPGKDGRTDAQDTDVELAKFTNAGARAEGESRKSILVLDVESKDAVPVWVAMNTSVALDKIDAKKEALGQTVCRHVGVPPILCGFAKPGQLGAAQEILNAVEMTQDDVLPLRKTLYRAFTRVIKAAAGQPIGNRKPISFIPPELMAALTPEEKRRMAQDFGVVLIPSSVQAQPTQP